MASKQFVVLLDMDSTVYDLLTPTLSWVNKIYDKQLTPADITEWRWDKKHSVTSVSLKVAPEVFWNMQNTYLNLKPIEGSIQAIEEVSKWRGVRQVFLSSANFKYATEKFQAVDRDFPFIGSKDVLLTGGNKDLVNGQVLVDDGPHNLEQFSGYKILADLHRAPYCKYPQADYVMTDWKDYPRIINNLLNKGWAENVG